MAPVVAQPPAPIRKKKLVRRAGRDRSQTLRRTVQLAFFVLNAWIGIEFYLFVRYYETGGRSVWAARPPGVEGWLPIASLMNLKVLLRIAALFEIFDGLQVVATGALRGLGDTRTPALAHLAGYW